jgi:hypothetical protein
MCTKKDNTCGVEGVTTLTSFKSIVNMRTYHSSVEGTAAPLNFNHVMMAK